MDLTNDPKFMADVDPELAKRLLEGNMIAEVGKDHRVTFSKFKVLAGKDAIKARN